MNIRDRMKTRNKRNIKDILEEHIKHREELERQFREDSRKFWRKAIWIHISLWTIIAAELIVLWYVKTH